MEHPVLLFDGICNFCDASVNFAIERDPEKKLRFATLQSEVGQTLLKKFGLPTENFSTAVFVIGEKYYLKSSAGLRVVRYLKGIWPLASIFLIVPPFIRDFFYDIIAKNRYRWFGMKEACVMPTPDIQGRFFNSTEEIGQKIEQ